MKKTPRTLAEKIIMWVGSPSSLMVHSIIFIVFFVFILLGYDSSTVLLILTTIVSLEAIYLSIFIQIAINKNTKSLEDVTEDIEEIQEDMEEISEDV
jgi:low affinity Fe/Cu permease